MIKIAVVLAVLLIWLSPSYISASEISFISSEEEFIGVMQADSVKGIAIRSEFYNSSGPIVKSQISFLVNKNINKLIPIFFYGYDIDRTAIKTMLNKQVEFKCNPIIMAGFFGTIPLNSVDFRGHDVFFCAAGNIEIMKAQDAYEDWFREWIENDWIVKKEELKALGYAILN